MIIGFKSKYLKKIHSNWREFQILNLFDISSYVSCQFLILQIPLCKVIFMEKTISKLSHLKAFYKIRHLGDENLSDYVFGATLLVLAINFFGSFLFKESNFLVVCNRNLFNNFIFQSLLGFFVIFLLLTTFTFYFHIKFTIGI